MNTDMSDAESSSATSSSDSDSEEFQLDDEAPKVDCTYQISVLTITSAGKQAGLGKYGRRWL